MEQPSLQKEMAKLWVIDNESTLQLVAEFPASNTAEGGLLGLELDPDYQNNHFCIFTKPILILLHTKTK